ncbi:MAG: glycosyltransferase 87 family protein [Chloroflexota bacterium]|nr:glycosyltransferase 87 family protein [Chloroflexota bacterium]
MIQVVLAGFFIHPWDGFVFLESTQQFLQGTTPYQVAMEELPSTSVFGMEAWYAYPPLPVLIFATTFAPYFFLFGNNLILERVFLKLSFIIGNLLCAFLVYRLVESSDRAELASKAEKVILYNPFLIFIAAVWGMFDVWMVNFLLLSIIRLRQHRLLRAGGYLGLSVLVKPIALIFLPVFLIYIWNKTGRIVKALSFATISALVFCIISIPFFASSPDGFIQQVTGIHAARPPGGTAPLALLYLGGLVGGLRDFGFFHLPLTVISTISVVLLGSSILLLLGYLYLRREKQEREFLASLLVVMIFFTLFNKVVNPQYFVTPIVLGTLLMFSYDKYDVLRTSDISRYCGFLVIPLTLSQVFEGRHFLLFIPPDIAMRLWGKTGEQLDLQAAASAPFSPDIYYTACQVIFGILIAPVCIMAGVICYRVLSHIIPELAHHLVACCRGLRIKVRNEDVLVRVLSILLVGSFIILPICGALITYKCTPEKSSISPVPLGEKAVGCFYYSWWHNSSRNPDRQYDNWDYTGLVPEEGYYNINQAYMKDDIQAMKGIGIDFTIAPVHNIYSERYFLLSRICEDEEMFFAPLIELYDLYIDRPALEPISDYDEQIKQRMITRIQVALSRSDSPAYLRFEEKPVVFIHNSPYFPIDEEIGIDSEFWRDIQSEVEEEHGDVCWIIDAVDSEDTNVPNGFDAGFLLPSTAWPSAMEPLLAIEDWNRRTRQLSGDNHIISVVTVVPYYDDRIINPIGKEIPAEINGVYTYDRLWRDAIDQDADIILVFSWNEYFEGSCIETSREFGDVFIRSTDEWIQAYKCPR